MHARQHAIDRFVRMAEDHRTRAGDALDQLSPLFIQQRLIEDLGFDAGGIHQIGRQQHRQRRQRP